MTKIIPILLTILYSVSAYAQDSGKFFNNVQIGYSKGFKVYGLNDNNFQLKDENFTSVVSVDMHIYRDHYIYGEFINQPMMKLKANDFPIEFDFIFYESHFDAYVRSHGFCVGYMYSREWLKNLESMAFIGVGRSYLEIREYYTDMKTLNVTSYDTKDTVRIVSVGLGLRYTLPNNFGFIAQAAFATNSPVFKLGISYKLKPI